MSHLVADARLVRVIVATFGLALVIHQAYATFPLHLERTGFTPVVYGSLMSLNGLLIIVIELWVTTLTRRLPSLLALAIGLLLNGIGFGAIGIAGSVPALAATVVVWTFGEMVYSPVGSAYIADISPPELRGRYQAAYAFTYSLGLMLAPIGGTLLYSQSPSALWLSCLVLCMVAAGWLTRAWLRERVQRDEAALEGSGKRADNGRTGTASGLA